VGVPLRPASPCRGWYLAYNERMENEPEKKESEIEALARMVKAGFDRMDAEFAGVRDEMNAGFATGEQAHRRRSAKPWSAYRPARRQARPASAGDQGGPRCASRHSWQHVPHAHRPRGAHQSAGGGVATTRLSKMIEDHYGHITPVKNADRILLGLPGWQSAAAEIPQASR
jgi:hypothetical protein